VTLAPNPFAIAADLLFPEPSTYLNDPVRWATTRLCEFWWSGQREIAGMVVRNRYSAIKASHDVSKSHTVSRLACWWIDVHPPGDAFVVTTAPTTAQVEAILWRYIGNAHRKAGLPGPHHSRCQVVHRQRARRVRPQTCRLRPGRLPGHPRPLRARDHRRGRRRTEVDLRCG
jgi:hypothetical protein